MSHVAELETDAAQRLAATRSDAEAALEILGSELRTQATARMEALERGAKEETEASA